MKTVLAKFPTGEQLYSYFIPEGDAPKVGDIILTSVSWSTKDITNYSIGEGEVQQAILEKGSLATIVSVHSHGSGSLAAKRANKFYVILIPMQFLMDRHGQNQKMVDRVKRQNEIRALLEDKLKAQTERDKYRQLALHDPEAAALLDELDAPTLDQIRPKQDKRDPAKVIREAWEGPDEAKPPRARPDAEVKTYRPTREGLVEG